MSPNDLFVLIDAIAEAYDNPNYKPKSGITHCNQGVQYICEKMGYNKFDGMLANEMVNTMRASLEWAIIKVEDAQGYANEGRLVIAGQQNEPHGHVVIIRPGVADHSAKWGVLSPKVVNIGADNFLDKGLAWVFRDKPEVFLYKG